MRQGDRREHGRQDQDGQSRRAADGRAEAAIMIVIAGDRLAVLHALHGGHGRHIRRLAGANLQPRLPRHRHIAGGHEQPHGKRERDQPGGGPAIQAQMAAEREHASGLKRWGRIVMRVWTRSDEDLFRGNCDWQRGQPAMPSQILANSGHAGRPRRIYGRFDGQPIRKSAEQLPVRQGSGGATIRSVALVDIRGG